MRPELLHADNWTPRTRTPWGGRKIPSQYKAGLDGLKVQEVVGESWEVSVEPSVSWSSVMVSLPASAVPLSMAMDASSSVQAVHVTRMVQLSVDTKSERMVPSFQPCVPIV